MTNYYSYKLLLEKNRKELLAKQKRETPERVKRSESYSISKIEIDPQALVNNWLVITTTISGNSKYYTCIIAFKNVFTDLLNIAKNDSSHTVNSKLIIKSIHLSLDNNDIYIDCSCPDFTYRYAYFATKDNFKWGKLQNSNGQEIRNPNNDIGCMCKHVYALLRSNKFLNRVSDKIMRTIMANIDILFKKYNIDPLEFKVNTAAYDKMLRMNITRDKSGKFVKQTSNEVDNKDDINDNDEKNNN